MIELDNKTAFITGGTKGIGYGTATTFVKEGVSVAITGRSQKTVDDAVEKLNSAAKDNAKAYGFQADVRKFMDQQIAVQKAVEAMGKIDVIVANAGVGLYDTIDKLSVEDWEKTIDTNVNGPFYTLKAGLAQLRENKGYFFTIGSLAGTNFFKAGTAYNASKFAMTGFTQSAMLDMREWDIKTSLIMPGSVATHFSGNEPDDSDAWKIQKEDIGEIIVDLLKMNRGTLPSKVEVRPSFPHKK